MRILTDITMIVEFSAATDIDDACEQMCILAARLGCTIKADFNGVTLLVKWNGSASRLREEYSLALNGRSAIKIACA